MVVVWRAAVVRACEVDRKKDYIHVKVIISTAWEEWGGGGAVPTAGLRFNS